MSPSTKTFETKLNIYLSRILNEKLGIQSIAETKLGEGRPDVLIFVGGIKIIIEGSYSKNDAEKDIEKKVNNGLADIGIALYYKENIPDVTEKEVVNKLEKSKFDVKIFLPEILPKKTSNWTEVDVFELTSLIKDVYEILVKEEFVTKFIQEIESSTNDFVERLKSIDKNQKIAESLYNILYHLHGLYVGDYKQISELIYAQAFLTILLSLSFYQSIYLHIGRKSLAKLVEEFNEKEALRKAFYDIYHNVDYKPIYGVALQVIETLPDQLLKNVIEIGTKLGSSQTLLKKDFSGRIYHKIVGDWSIRKGFATFFTTIPASYLLAYLSVFSEFGKFKDPENVKVCDFTCGSGTLLTAAYSALEDLYSLEKFEVGEIDLDSFHKRMLEKNMWGFDALRYALQIASLNLVFHNPTTTLENMNFYSIPLGIDEKGNVVLGSLKFLKKGTLIQYFNVETFAKKSTSIDASSQGQQIPSFDFIIMNPPFTRATGRGGKEGGGLFGFLLDQKIREKVLDNYKKTREIIKVELVKMGSKYLKNFEESNFSGIGQAGEGLLFLYLAYEYLNSNGRIAFVLPKSFLTGSSWFLIRALLLEKFNIEYVIVSYDNENGYNFSESTNLSEALIIARKGKPIDNQNTKFIMLLKKPLTTFEAKSLAKSITNNENYASANNSMAFINIHKREKLVDNIDNWGKFVAFPNNKLLNFVAGLEESKLFGKKIPITKLGEKTTIGVDRHQFHDMFKIINKKIPNSYPILLGGEEEQRTYMLGKTNAFALPKDKKSEEIFKKKSSYLLVPDRIRVTTAHVISTMTPNKTLSNIFYAIKLNEKDDEAKYKALCSWLNSTFGILLILANREETEGGWISLKMSHWNLQSILNISELNRQTINKLAEIFDRYKNQKLERLPNQYFPENVDKVRFEFDKEVLNALKIKFKEEDLKELYKMIHESFQQWLETKNN